jgi:hypothetical protein
MPFVEVDGYTVHVTLVRGGKGQKLTERDVECIREMARCLKQYGAKIDRVRYERGPDVPGPKPD